MHRTTTFALASSFPRVRALAALALVAALVSPLTASATSYVMMADEDLVDRAAVIVHGRVIGMRVLNVDGAPYTEHVVEVFDTIRGSVGETILFRQLGGELPDGAGMSLKIIGLPEYRMGEGVVLFLESGKDNTYRAADTLLGGFRTVGVEGRTFAVRDLGGSDRVEIANVPEHRRDSVRQAHQPRDLNLWIDWLRDRVAGAERAPDYFAATDAVPTNVQDAFSLLLTSDGQAIRWTDFNDGQAVEWGVHKKKRQKGLPSKGVTQARDGLQAWNKTGNINYVFTGKINASGGLTTFDNKNSLQYNDQNNAIAGAFDCSTGGTLAIGGPWFGSATHARKGKTYRTTAGADVVFQNGLECFFKRVLQASNAATQIVGHEAGHTLGIGHSAKPALMEPTFKDNGKAADILKDDRKAAVSKKGMQYKG